MLTIASFTGCQHPKPPPPPAPPPPKITYSETYDREIKEIMELAKQEKWEEAQAKAQALYQNAGYERVREEVAAVASNKALGGGIRRYHFTKAL